MVPVMIFLEGVFATTEPLEILPAREHLTDPNEGLTDTQIRLGKQVSQVKVSYFVRKQSFVFNQIWKERYQQYSLNEGVINKGEEGPTNDPGWPLSGQRVSQARMVENVMFVRFIRSLSVSVRFLCGRSTFAKLENKEIQSVLEEGFLFLTERWNIWEYFTGREHLLVGLSSGGPSDPCMWLRGTNLRRTS